ncbi:MAG: selenocysteine-specific translation elongation factor [Deltaproteobacteria bacterium]|jgi:selenocysteine-specific elongation factor|nr:selenocysteine-specific translation elongation factor [Deltaproteobacteria bacterium]
MASNRHMTIGTAGHVDHGKTALVKAMTGIDTDRLVEEKRRGITIENGFAHLNFPDGLVAGIIDVPGHERFVRHMLAGSGGIDIALLVVAADDGVMPQTREHLDILKLLNIKTGVVALTKCDLISDPEWLELIVEDIRALTDGAFQNELAIVPVSAQTNQGLKELTDELHKALLTSVPRPVGPSFRLPLDRVFTMGGFGTVVTGTLLDGQIKTGDQVRAYPEALESRVKQIQVYGKTTDSAYPGQRVALNLAALKKTDLNRGDVLATPGSLNATFMLDAHLSVLPNSPFSLKNNGLVQLHLAAREVTAKVVLMKSERLTAGESDYAQFRLTVPVVARRGDRLVIRLPSPAITIGGGEILDAFPQKHRRHKPNVIDQYQTKETGSLKQRVELAIIERPGTFATLPQLVLRADLGPKARAEANKLADQGLVIALTKDVYIHKTEINSLTQKLKNLLTNYHKTNPYNQGLSTGELREKLAPKASPSAWEGLQNHWKGQNVIAQEGGFTRLNSFEPLVDETENQYLELLERDYLEFGLKPLATSTVQPTDDPDRNRRRKAAFATLVRAGKLIPLDNLYHIHFQAYEQAWGYFKALAKNGPVELGSFRDALNTSRKIAFAILESFENRALAVKSGAGRLPQAIDSLASRLGLKPSPPDPKAAPGPNDSLGQTSPLSDNASPKEGPSKCPKA